MTITRFARTLAETHRLYHVDSLNAENCTEATVSAVVADILPPGTSGFRFLPEGRSAEGRRLPLIRFGNGPVRILFWSQMHGDEPTATLALMDMFAFLARDGLVRTGLTDLPHRCSLFFIPILNPDGAERRTRQTSDGIDMNRDARRFATPEARFLRKAHRSIRPSFGFNLHDQELSTVGSTGDITALALLAPAADAKRKVNATRRAAMQVASCIVRALEPLAKGRLASYNDAFEPRAFGDRMQSWGTSTVLVESGHWKNDPGKETIRRLNFVALLSAVRSIADGSHRKSGLAAYQGLEPNGKRAYDIIVRGAAVGKVRTDIGFQLERARGSVGMTARVRELGDLGGLGAVLDVPGRNVRLEPGIVQVESTLGMTELRNLIGVNGL